MITRHDHHGLTPNELKFLEEQSNLVTYHKGDLVLKQNTPASQALYVKKGLVKVVRESACGRRNILEINGADQYIGLLSLIGNLHHEFTVIALTNVDIQFINAKAFMTILKDNPYFSDHILSETSSLALRTINRLVTINNKQLPGRVADVILYFFELNDREREFELPLTRSELAQFAGTTKESFIRTLTEFKNDKIIQINDKRITINSMEIVQTLSRLG